MNNFKNYSLAILAISFFLFSCEKDEAPVEPLGQYESGVFIINEGAFGQSNASMTHYDPNAKTVTNQIFFKKNNSSSLGDVFQSYFIHDTLGFNIINNSNTVEIVNANTFKSLGVVDVSLPRYMTTNNTKAYLSEWVSFSDPGRVSVINLNDLELETTITVGYGAENLLVVDNMLYVSNNFQSDISIIDLESNQVVKTLEVGSAPGGLLLDANNDLWVACGGGSDENWAPLNNGSLVKISTATNTVTTTVALGANIPTKISINSSKDAILYLVANEVFKLAISEDTKPAKAFITTDIAGTIYGIGVNPSTDVIYLADSKGFAENGQVYRYNADGSVLDNFEVSVGPNGFVFK
jgi:YVTN family beta-propeller protein